MKGPDLINALEREGFMVSRRSKSLVWLVRGDDQLLVDSDSNVEEGLAREILSHARGEKT